MQFPIRSVITVALVLTAWKAFPMPGDVDSSFNPYLGGDQFIRTTAIQPDGKIVIGGWFNSVNGQPRKFVARLFPDGSLESANSFNPGTGSNGVVGVVYSAAIQPDGKILLGGGIGFARLNPDGTVEGTNTFYPGAGANSTVEVVTIQPDGKILLGGSFTAMSGQPRNYIARLNTDGTLESTNTFNIGSGPNGDVDAIALQPDGKILLAGWGFTTVNGQPRSRLARLNPDGTVESTNTFNPGAGPDWFVYGVGTQPDGRILLEGQFGTIAGQYRPYFARLGGEGSVESTNTFNMGIGPNAPVYSYALQADGKIIIGGSFTTVNGQPRNYIARLNPDGTLEGTNTFNVGSGPDNVVHSVALQADGKILLRGSFTSVNGQAHTNIARLLNDAATQSLAIPNSSRVQWLRGGAAPEVEQVSFEITTNGGGSWSLGAGTRIAGGWQRTGLNLPANGWVRVRGRTSGGYFNDSSGLIESVAPFGAPGPLTTTLLASAVGFTTATLNGVVTPNGLATVAWFSWGTNTLYGNSTTITNAGAGTNSVTLTANLSGLATSNSYHFQAVVSNAAGLFLGPDQVFTTLPSTNASLSALSATVTLSPSFNSNTTSYTAPVSRDISNVVITASSAEPTALIQIGVAGGAFSSVNSGSPSPPLPLGIGYNFIQIRVTAQDRTTMKTYGLEVVRAGLPPVVNTYGAGSSSITATSAVLTGIVVPYASSTAAYFIYGTDPNFNHYYGSTSTNVGSGVDSVNIAIPVSGLYPQSTYYVRLYAYNPFGNVSGGDKTFTTLGMPHYTTPYTFTTLAGYAAIGHNDGIGGNAQFSGPAAVARDTNGNAFVADTGNSAIRKITPAGVVTTIAGFPGSSGSADGVGSSARFNGPQGIAVDTTGNLYVADTYNETIRRITPAGTNWITSTIAGLAGTSGSADGIGNNARFNLPKGVSLDIMGNVFVADTYNLIVRKITPAGTNWVVSTIAGLAGYSGNDDGTNSAARFSFPICLAIDSSNNIYVGDNGAVRQLSPAGSDWSVSTIAGLAFTYGSTDGTNGTARFARPSGIAVDGLSNLYVSDSGPFQTGGSNQYTSMIRKVSPIGTNWVVATLAGAVGGLGFRDGTGTNAQFDAPQGLAADDAGNLYVADTGNHAIRKVSSSGLVRTLAGATGSRGSTDGVGSTARFFSPYGVAVDNAGNAYIADWGNSTVRQITPAGDVSTLAGLAGSRGPNDGVGEDARFYSPEAITVDGAWNIYVADSRLRKITPAGQVSTILPNRFGFQGVGVDQWGTIYVCTYNSIEALTLSGTNWLESLVAGGFNYPHGVAVDSATNIYVADTYNHTIRKIAPSGTNWVVSTIAGLAQFWGVHDGYGSNARFFYPYGLALDRTGNLYVADGHNHTIRKLTSVGGSWLVSTIGGSPGVSGSSDGAGSSALFSEMNGIAVDSGGAVYVADTYNNTIRKGVFTAYTAANALAYTPPPNNGSLVVTLSPQEANGQWRFTWELNWRTNGEAVSNLTPGEYPLEFRNTPGWLPYPPTLSVIVSTGGPTNVTGEYFPTISASGTNTGSLIVNIGPNAPTNSGWRFIGESDADWRAAGTTVTNLLPDTYFIEFKPVSGRSQPPAQAAQVFAGQGTVVFETYALAQSAPVGAELPFAVPTSNITDLATYPFGFNGQLKTDAGYGSGVAVLSNVVLTAAHMVFNDQTLSYVSQAWWFFRAGAEPFPIEPKPARGWHVLGSYSAQGTNTYAAQRTNDLQVYAPGYSTPQSRNLDVAALYFQSAAAGGGYGGYLPSDSSPNPWLTGTALKMLVGYPVDGSVFGDTNILSGIMYQTEPQPYPLNRATDPIYNQQVYTAPWFLSYPGNSGGPLYVYFNGYYYPAAVYLGTLYNGIQPYASLVRAIDSDVENLITNAATLGDSGVNGSGGTITIITGRPGYGSLPYLEIDLGPPEAIAAGAASRVLEENTNYFSSSKYVLAIISGKSNVTIEFTNIPGWAAPPTRTASVASNSLSLALATYLRLPKLNGIRVLPGDRIAMTLNFDNSTARNYSLQLSTNLIDWTDVSFFTNATSAITFTNPLAPRTSKGFYRAKEL